MEKPLHVIYAQLVVLIHYTTASYFRNLPIVSKTCTHLILVAYTLLAFSE